MRISDWSSDVCSSDLHGLADSRHHPHPRRDDRRAVRIPRRGRADQRADRCAACPNHPELKENNMRPNDPMSIDLEATGTACIAFATSEHNGSARWTELSVHRLPDGKFLSRSEVRSVGKGGVRTGKSRWM